MNTRQAKLLTAIIDEFIQTGIPVGSKQILDRGFFLLSGATIRNEMRALGEEGLLEQPHTSAGRIPTAKGYQLYVREYMEPTSHEKEVRSRFDILKQQYLKRKDQERVYEAVTLLSQMIPNLAFATVPHKEQVYYMGLANTLRQPEFQSNPMLATGVVEVLENRLSTLLDHAEINKDVQFFIGDEHVLPQIQSCSMLVKKYSVRGEEGVIGILGPMRMDYGYNSVALELVSDLLEAS